LSNFELVHNCNLASKASIKNSQSFQTVKISEILWGGGKFLLIQTTTKVTQLDVNL